MSPFEKLDGKDGFHITLVTAVPGELSLHCNMYGGGELQNFVNPQDPDAATIEIRVWKKPTAEDSGAALRLYHVLSAVTRYLSTGGSWEELERGLSRVKIVAQGGLVFPGWYLHDSYVAGVGEFQSYFQHIFVHQGTNDAMLWEEPQFSDRGTPIGGFLEAKTLAQIEEERIEDAWQSQRRGAAPGSDEDTGVSRLSDLRDSADEKPPG